MGRRWIMVELGEHCHTHIVPRLQKVIVLAAAMCKLAGFSYAPSEVLWWQQGHNSERDFIYVTTQTLSAEQLGALSSELGADLFKSEAS